MVRGVGAALSEGDDATAKKIEALALAVEDRREAALSRAAGQEAVRFACAAGSLAVTRPGAQDAMPQRDEVEALLRGP